MTETSTPAIDRAAIIEKLKDLARMSEEGDREEPHMHADGILCGLLCKLGFKDVVEAYHEVDKWFC